MKHLFRLLLIIALFLEAISFLFKFSGSTDAAGFVHVAVFASLFLLTFSFAGLLTWLIKARLRPGIFSDLKPEILLFLAAILVMVLVGITGWD